MDTAESAGAVDAQQAGTAAPFTAQGWLERFCSKSKSKNKSKSDGGDGGDGSDGSDGSD